jgi:hypothetical protein
VSEVVFQIIFCHTERQFEAAYVTVVLRGSYWGVTLAAQRYHSDDKGHTKKKKKKKKRTGERTGDKRLYI